MGEKILLTEKVYQPRPKVYQHPNLIVLASRTRGINCCSTTQYVGFYCNSTRQWDKQREVQTSWFNTGDDDACVRSRLPHFPQMAARMRLPPPPHSSTLVFIWDCSFLPSWPCRSCLLRSSLPCPINPAWLPLQAIDLLQGCCLSFQQFLLSLSFGLL